MDFRKMMTGFYMHSVCLPEEVTEHFDGLAGQLLELRCPGRGTWYVGLVRMGDRLVLQPGWSKFAGTNNVWQNDLLHFKSVCGTTFEVRIFDPCGREVCDDIEGGTNEVEVREETIPFHGSKKRSWSEKNDSIHPAKRIRTTEVEVQEETKPCHNSEKRPSGKSNNSLRLTKRIITNEVEVQETMPCRCDPKKRSLSKNNDPNYPNKRIKIGECCITCQEDEIPDSKEEFLQIDNRNEDSSMQKNITLYEDQLKEEQNNGLPVTEHDAILGRNSGLLLENGRSETAIPDSDVLVDNIYSPLVRQTLSAELKARANNLAHRIQGNNPAFVCLLQPSCATRNSCVRVPKEFLAMHLLQEVNQKILLCLPESGNTWSVDYYRLGRRIRGTSWVKFIRENDLRKGDMCMFELVSTADQITFVVHVSRATLELNSSATWVPDHEFF